MGHPSPHYSIESIQNRYRKLLDSIDIDILIMHVTGKSREFVLAHPEYVLSETEYAQAIEYLDRRAAHEPIAYITGHKEFYGLDFVVNQHTLIPRPETELMVDETLTMLSTAEKQKPLIIDVGTGSGNIIITIAKELLEKNIEAVFFGVDISEGALAVAEYNAARHKVGDSIKFLQSDLLKAFFTPQKIQPGSRVKPGMTLQSFQSFNHIIILANLPYLSEEIYQSAEADVKDFEPITALVSDEFGLAHYRKLLEQITTLRQKNILPSTTPIMMIFEISPEQHDAAETLIQEFFPLATVSFIKDYSQRFRFVKIFL